MAEVVAAEQVGKVVLSADPEVEGLAAHLRSLGVEVLDGRAPADAAGADLGITGALFGLAATGSVAVAAGRAGGRSVSLLPPVHLALVPASRVVPSASEVWRRMPEHFPDRPPSQLVFISGPSRSADIEFTLTVGVHGPKRVWWPSSTSLTGGRAPSRSARFRELRRPTITAHAHRSVPR